jgi:periplasmic protein TonB
MVDRTLVPSNARMSQRRTDGPVEDSVAAVKTEHLVPRHLVPANAKLPETKPFEARGDAGDGAKRDLPVRRTLVPANAQIDSAASQTGPLELRGGPARQNLFQLDEALLDKAFAEDARKPVDWLVSLAVHFAVVAVVMLIPLFVTQAIDLGQLRYTYLVAPPLNAPGPPPPPPPVAMHPQQAPRTQSLVNKLIAPVAIPKAIEMPRVAEEPPAEEAMGVPGGVAGGVPGGQIGGVLGGALGGENLNAPPPPLPAAAPAPPSVPSGPLRVGGQVKAPHVIFAPQPEYPMLAKQARLQGVVQIEAVIDEHGNVVQMKAVSGSGILIPAAMRAVAQWKYEPTYLNGVPYPVTLTVEVTFHM